MSNLRLLLVIVGLFGCVSPCSADESVTISEPTADANGFLIHSVNSTYQAGTTQIRVLLPDKLERDKLYPVIYILPVEAGTENRYGDGLLEIKRQELHNRTATIFVAPTFSHLPWYADHPTNVEIRQESYLLKAVVPFIDKTYPVESTSKGRLLLGFSKSGWGAFSLLLRHPDTFAKAAAWDAPLMMDKQGLYGSGEIFGTAENFASYQLTKLFQDRAPEFQNEMRLFLVGSANFRNEHEKAHSLLFDLKIPHDHRVDTLKKHDWHSGWVTEAVQELRSSD